MLHLLLEAFTAAEQQKPLDGPKGLRWTGGELFGNLGNGGRQARGRHHAIDQSPSHCLFRGQRPVQQEHLLRARRPMRRGRNQVVLPSGVNPILV